MKQLAPKVKFDEKNKAYYITTSQFRVSFPKLAKAEAMEEGQDKKFSVAMLFPKKHDRKYLIDACNHLIKLQWGNKPPANLKKPFKDGDSLSYDGYAGMMACNGTSKEEYPIRLISQTKQELQPRDMYAGCWARASITLKAYDMKVNKGVAIYVQGLQKIADDEPFGNVRDVADDFESDDIESPADADNEENYGDSSPEPEEEW